jgi:hypothetical protein
VTELRRYEGTIKYRLRGWVSGGIRIRTRQYTQFRVIVEGAESVAFEVRNEKASVRPRFSQPEILCCSYDVFLGESEQKHGGAMAKENKENTGAQSGEELGKVVIPMWCRVSRASGQA